MSHDIIYMWNLKILVQMTFLQNRSRVTDVENRIWLPRDKEEGDKLGDWE